MTQGIPGRPASVRTAVMLLYVASVMGAVRDLIDTWPHTQASWVAYHVCVILAVLALVAFVISRIGRGSHSARLVLLVLFILGVPFSVTDALFVLGGRISGVLSLGQLLLGVEAFVLLFQRPSAEWFRATKT